MDAHEITMQNNLEYMSLNKGQRILYKISHFFKGIPKKASKVVSETPQKVRTKGLFITNIFKTIYKAFAKGDFKTRLSYLLMGFGLVTRHQIIRGSLYFLYECFFFVFMALIGFNALGNLPSLGQLAQVEYTVFDQYGKGIIH